MREAGKVTVEAVDLVRRHRQGDVVVPALRGVSLTVAGGELVAVVGPSGSGKSTLLHLLAGVDVPDAGRVVVAGAALHALSEDARAAIRRRTIGLVFQACNLVPLLTALENVALPLLLDGEPPRRARARALAALAAVGLAERAARTPDRLSGGEAQRVAVARALVADPPLVLADEPTGSLDAKSAEGVLTLLRDATAGGTAIVLVTHDPRAAARADRVIRLVDGRIAAELGEDACARAAS
ncbi:MAG: ABC transporter ATP-binding protein [Deltaproteobacteria bacterium]|nr:ABC transporter ATP-binding protein [Deltaproteobacteria bacterium]